MKGIIDPGAAIALILCQLLFSGWHILSLLVFINGANPLIFALYRGIFACLLMVFYVSFLKVKIIINDSDWPLFIIVGFFCFMNIFGAVVALSLISPTHFAVLQPTIPCVATLISIIMRLENCSLLKGLGVCIAVGGAIAMETLPGSIPERNYSLGIVLACAGILGMANVLVLQKTLLKRYEPSVVTLVYYSIGTFFTFLLCIVWQMSYPSFTLKDLVFHNHTIVWLGLAYAFTFATMLTLNLYSWAGKRLTPSMTSCFSTLQPITTAILSWFLFNDVITAREVAGGVVVICGLFLAVYGRHLEEADEQRANDTVTENPNEHQQQQQLVIESCEQKHDAQKDDPVNIDEYITKRRSCGGSQENIAILSTSDSIDTTRLATSKYQLLPGECNGEVFEFDLESGEMGLENTENISLV